MSSTGAAPDHKPEMKVGKCSHGQGADLEFVGAVGQEVEGPAHCKSEATAEAAAQHRSAQKNEMLDPESPAELTADEAIIKLFPTEDQAVIKQVLERYKGSPPPNVIEALTALGHARRLNASSKRGNVTVAEGVEEEEEVEEEDEEVEEGDEDVEEEDEEEDEDE